MDCIFVRGVHNRASVDTDLMDLFQTKGYLTRDIPVVRIMEGYPLDMRARVFINTLELADLIVDCFRDTDVFNRAMVHIDDDLKVLYLMFTTTNDVELPAFLTMAVQGCA